MLMELVEATAVFLPYCSTEIGAKGYQFYKCLLRFGLTSESNLHFRIFNECAHAHLITCLVCVPFPHACNPLSVMWTVLQQAL